MSNCSNFSKMFHARCIIPSIVRKIFFRYNLLLIPITIGKKCFPLIYNLYLTLGVFLSVNFGNHRTAPITWDPITDSPDEMIIIVQIDMFGNMSIIVLTQIHIMFVHFFGIESVSSYFH